MKPKKSYFLVMLMTMLLVGATHADKLPKPGDFPQQALTIIIPGSPGAGSHQLSVTMQEALEQVLEGVEVNVINKPGGNGQEAIEYYTTLPPNGYTILQHFDNIASLFARGKIATHPTRDLIPLAITQLTLSQLYIRNEKNETRFRDWRTFAAYVKVKPNKIKVALFGRQNSMESLLVQMLKRTQGLAVIEKPFERSDERYKSLIKGEVDALIEQPGDVRTFLEGKVIKPVLSLSPRRDPNIPVPSFGDIHGEFEALYRFRGFFVHSAAPTERVQYLERAFKLAYETPRFRKFNQTQSMLPASYRDREQASQFILDTISTYRRIIKQRD